MIRNLPRETRPREKLMKRGVKSLSDAELLAIILRTGIKGQNVIHLSQELIDQFAGLPGLLNCSYEEIKNIRGLGYAKFAQITAIREISKRSLKAEVDTKPVLDNVQAVNEYLQAEMSNYNKEVFVCLLLDSRNYLLHYEEVFYGSIDRATIYPREIIKLVIAHNATAVIFAHNHPSGHLNVSNADKRITERLKQALGLIDVKVLDHIIVGRGTLSMAELGLV